MPSKSCCRSCPRCNDCPVLVAARARAQRREEHTNMVATLVEDVFAGGRFARTLPDSVTRTLEALDAARTGASAPVTA
jgi:hypothetical protein